MAKEKLIEKEKEIFKLTKEVVELKVFKASVKHGFSEASTPSDCKDSEAVAGATFGEIREFPCDSPDKENCSCFDEKIEEEPEKESPCEKLSPVSPFHGYHREKFTATPDYLLSSLADSGHFDDLISIQSKDSLNIPGTSEEQPDGVGETARMVNFYETLLQESRDTHDKELRSLQLQHEENTMKMVDSFDGKMKEQEQLFEEKISTLLKRTENEKIEIVERFEKRLEDERLRYLGNVHEKKDITAQTELHDCDSYFKKVEEEKQSYETSLAAIKKNFESEREKIEKSFDGAMFAERAKFELAVQEIQRDYDKQIALVSEKSSGDDKKYAYMVFNNNV